MTAGAHSRVLRIRSLLDQGRRFGLCPLAATMGLVVAGCGSTKRAEPPILFERGHEIRTITDQGTERVVTEGENAVWLPGRRQIAFTRVAYVQPSPLTSVWTAQADGHDVHLVVAARPPDQVRFIAAGGHPARIALVDDKGIWLMDPDGSHIRLVAATEANDVSVSPDGARLVYVTGNIRRPSALKVIDMNGGSESTAFAPTPHSCGVNSPSWSPDGRWLAFSLCVDKGGLEIENGIWLVRPDGRGLHRIALDGTGPSWSPDGRWITYVSSRMNSAHNDELVAIVEVTPEGRRFSKITRFTPSSAPRGQQEPPERPQW
jgi:Tol biopolymer transport system component